MSASTPRSDAPASTVAPPGLSQGPGIGSCVIGAGVSVSSTVGWEGVWVQSLRAGLWCVQVSSRVLAVGLCVAACGVEHVTALRVGWRHLRRQPCQLQR